MDDLVLRGSQTAKNGFKNEKEIAYKFNHWQTDAEVRQWLNIMGYDWNSVDHINARVITGQKADVIVEIRIKSKEGRTENIQVKLVSGKNGFNQIDKRWLSHYKDLWDMPNNVFEILQYFTGEKKPYKPDTKSRNRMFFNEMEQDKKDIVVKWFADKKAIILLDVLQGRGDYPAKWVLVAQKGKNNIRWTLKSIDEVLQYYGNGIVEITKMGSLKLGLITVQRKGGDGGKDTAKMLQFKLNPALLFDLP